MQAWYVKNFGARSGRGESADSINLGDTRFVYAHADSTVPTQGRAIDHIAFEVKGLEAFCQKLAESGVKLDSPYQTVPGSKIAHAFLTDPWGTRIELTEGLAP